MTVKELIAQLFKFDLDRTVLVVTHADAAGVHVETIDSLNLSGNPCIATSSYAKHTKDMKAPEKG